MLPRAMESLGLRKSGAVVHARRPRSMLIAKSARAKGYAKHAKSKVGEPTFLCRECEPDSWDGVIWPYYCECGRALCTLCIDRFAISYQHCPCFQCKECDRDQFMWPEERLTVKRYRCDHCGLDKCPTCWVNTGIKLKKCIECDRSLCEVCGVKLSCTDCNACVCEDYYNPTEYPNTVEGIDWHCEYCRGTVNDISCSNSILSALNSCLTCAYFGNEKQTLTTTLLARKKRQSTDITAGISDDQSITKRIRLENTTATTRYGDNSKSCTII
ncbi:hypothetical protein BGX38DRAFT_350212 [Terfezia claveryi]|nr:hypothetical protein BGX38DRAFT_350212 [Terfezia claveryi]